MSKIIDKDTVLTESDIAELKQVIAATDAALEPLRIPPIPFQHTPAKCSSIYYLLFEHMSKEHGLTLVESEMDEIVRIVSSMIDGKD